MVMAARRFSTGPVLRKEIQDAYILSAARTPTAKVSMVTIYIQLLVLRLLIVAASSMDHSSTFLRPSSAPLRSRLRSKSPRSP